MRTALTIAGLALVLGGVSACGSSDSDGGDGMPTSASTEEFCGNFEDLASSLGGMSADTDASEAVAALQDAAEAMEATGTPEDIPDAARSGLEATIGAIQDLGSDTTLDDISNLESTLSEDEKADAGEFDTYLSETCPDLG